MAWLIGILLLIFFLWLLVVSPGFRGLVLILIVVVGFGIWWLLDNRLEQERTARQLIMPSDIQLADLEMGKRLSGSTYELSGKIKNLSKLYSLRSLRFDIKAYDCPSSAMLDECDIIGQELETVYVLVPPGQVRDFSEWVSFSNMPPPRNFKWSYAITELKARTP